MKKNRLFFATALIMILFSCTKDNNYPKKFTQHEFINGEVRMVTKSGIVTNDVEIDNFAERVRNYFLNSSNAPDYVYSFDDDENIMAFYEIEIVFETETKGRIIIKSNLIDENQILNFNLTKEVDYSIISMHDTIESYYYYENPRFKCSPVVIERVPIQGGEIVSYLKPLYIKKNNDDILLCIVSYMETSYNSDNFLSSMSISGATNNMINDDHLTNIQASNYNFTDTIAYKESYIVFK